MNWRSVLIAAGSWSAACSACAQSQSLSQNASGAPSTTKAAQASSTSVGQVTVTARAQLTQRLPDRTVYSIVEKSPGAPLSDALRNIPSIDVDMAGNLALRGSSNVTILVDGQPSAEFQGPNRAQLLQQLSAERFERVEVMTAPSAAYSPEGAAGVINLITRKARNNQSLTLAARADTGGRVRLGASGGTAIGKVRLTANLSATYTPRKSSEAIDQRVVGTDAAAVATTNSDLVARAVSGTLKAAMDLSGRDTLTAATSGYSQSSTTRSAQSYVGTVFPAPLDASFYDHGDDRKTNRWIDGSLDFKHLLNGADRSIDARLDVTNTVTQEVDTHLTAYTSPDSGDALDVAAAQTSDLNATFHLEFDTPVLSNAKLSTGVDLNYDRFAIHHDETFSGLDTDLAPVDDDFHARQLISAVFATVDWTAGRFDILPGLRLEDYYRTSEALLLTGAQRDNDFAAYPTLAVRYQLDPRDSVTAKYSRRVTRPSLFELDPTVVRNDPLSFSQGNSELKPSYTNALEADLMHQAGRLSVDLDGFWRSTTGEVAWLLHDLGDGQSLLQPANIDTERHAGAELSASDRVSKQLTLGFDLTAQNDSLSGPYVLGGHRSGGWAQGKLKADWSLTKDDFVQIAYYAGSRRTTAQGATLGWQAFIVGYRRRLTDRVSVEIEAIDPFGTYHPTTVIQAADLFERWLAQPGVRAVSFSLTWTFGGAHASSQTRDFDASAVNH